MGAIQQLLMSYKVASSGNQPYTAAFLTATSIADATIISALNQLEIDLTAAGLIDYSNPSTNKFNALYPMVGGTASTHKYNFLDAQDTDGAFRLTFNGGLTHSSTGILPNGTNGYADTHLSPSGDFTVNDTHLSFYSRTNDTGNGGSEFSVYDGSGYLWGLSILYSGIGTISDMYYGSGANRLVVSNSDSRGFYTGSRTSSTAHATYKNGSSVGSESNTNVISLQSANLYLFAINLGGTAILPSTKECAFASAGVGLDSTENTDFYNAVQDFQTTLSRQV